MAYKGFDYQGAMQQGYSQDEILDFLVEQRKFNVQGARDAGYSDQEIIEFLSEKPERSLTEKAAGVGKQFGLGVVESATFPAELYVQSALSEGKQADQIRNEIVKDMEWLAEKKMFGTATPEDEQRLTELEELYKNPEKISEMTTDFGDVSTKGLIERSTGIDLEPEGVVEKTANIVGILKNPSKIAKAGLNPKALARALSPTGKDILKGIGIEAGIEAAEAGNFGPTGTLAAMVAGDIAAEGVMGVGKAILSPKKTVARFLSNRANKEMAQELVKDLRASGIKADIGTITNSDLVKMVQSKLDQSGLTGSALEDLRKQIFQDIKNEYNLIAEGIDEYKFATRDEAGKAMQNALEESRTQDLDEVREIYSRARENVVDTESVNVSKVNRLVERLEKDLAKGKIKSTDQKKVIDILEDLKGDILNESGELKNASPIALINNKIALNDIINYEAQGGAQQLLKGIVKEIDSALIKHGERFDKNFLRDYQQANARFKNHAETFRNKNISKLLREENPERLLKQMDTINGLNQLEKALSKTPEGKRVFEQLKRQKLDEMFSKSMVNSLEDQLKLGQFKNILDNPKNAELAQRLLGKDQYRRLKKLSKNANRIQQASAKFLNPSKSGVVISDIAAVSKLLSDFGHLFYGNPFPLMKSGSIATGARYLTKLMGDPEFITLVEDLILAQNKNDIARMQEIAERLRPYAVRYTQSSEE